MEEPVHSTERGVGNGTRRLSELKNSDDVARRLLQSANSKPVSGSGLLAGPDVRPATEVDLSKTNKESVLPLKIPTRPLDPQRYVVPERLLNIYLSGY